MWSSRTALWASGVESSDPSSVCRGLLGCASRPERRVPDTAVVRRAANVVVLSKDPAAQCPHRSRVARLLLMGNSHTYALPGLLRGQSLRSDPGETLIR